MNIPAPRTSAIVEAVHAQTKHFPAHVCKGFVKLSELSAELEREAAHHSAQLEKALGRIAQLEGAVRKAQDHSINALISGFCTLTPGIKQDMQNFLKEARALLHPDSTKKS